MIESVNQFFVRIKENDLFQPGQKRRYFHSCNYSYILFARGAKKLQKIIEEKGIFTSGDHMIVNHMEELNIYFMRPIVAGCFQDLILDIKNQNLTILTEKTILTLIYGIIMNTLTRMLRKT